MVEPLLLTHALAGAQKTESSKLHYACILLLLLIIIIIIIIVIIIIK